MDQQPLLASLRHRNGKKMKRVQPLLDQIIECMEFSRRSEHARGYHASLTSKPAPNTYHNSCSFLRDRFFKAQIDALYTVQRRQTIRQQQLDHRKMPSSCKDIRAALAECLQNSDCVMVQRNRPSDCLRPPLLETMPTKCQQLKKGYGECKRGMVDMRKRFRGNQPIGVSKEIEVGAGDSSTGQLYAGKPAFESTAKVTSGNEPEERDWREVENEKYRKG